MGLGCALADHLVHRRPHVLEPPVEPPAPAVSCLVRRQSRPTLPALARTSKDACMTAGREPT
eukprot:scaffold47090_cov43-Prasinocladus_malaysianus.AAC.1